MTLPWPDPSLIQVIGLGCDLAGAILIGLDVFRSSRSIIADSVDAATSYYGSPKTEDVQKRPAVRRQLRNRNLALSGVALLALGFILQIVATLAQT